MPVAAQGAISAVLGRDDPSYYVRETDAGLIAENWRHDLRVRFAREGAQVRIGGRQFGLALTNWGYGDSLGPVTPAAPRAAANRVEYARGRVLEWYVNGPAGLQHGFTLAAPPGRRGSGPLTLAIALSGTLAPSLDDAADGLVLGESRLRYRGLVAFDADGRDLPARMELRGRTLRLRVDDAGARYPITVDPFVQRAKLTASVGSSSANLGWSAAVSGETIVVGAPVDIVGTQLPGSAYVFVRPSSGWANATEAAKLTASDGGHVDEFGRSVAISGDTIVVGAPLDDITGANTSEGSAYVFLKPASGWVNATETAKLTASDGAAGDTLGRSVAVFGDTVVVGAPQHEVGGNARQGSAYVFVKPASGWVNSTETAKFTASDGAAGDRFGHAVAISGDTIVLGSFGNDVGANVDQGSAYVFVQPAAGWMSAMETAKLTASDGAPGDRFGMSVAVDGDTIVVGAENATVGTGSGPGSAYVFVRPSGGWTHATHTARLSASDGAAGDRFGGSVAVSGETIAVGAPGDDVSTEANQGSAYVFVKPALGWANAIETEKLSASDGAQSDEFGRSVAVSADAIVVGAPFDDITLSGQGSAYVFAFNNVPIAESDAYSMLQDTTLDAPPPGVLANDSDLDGDTLSAVLVSGPANGALTLNADGSFSYTPTVGFNGDDGFTYQASDGISDSTPVSVTIHVSPLGHDVGIAGGGFRISGSHDLSRSGSVETIVIKVKNYGRVAPEAIGYTVTSSAAGDAFSAGCTGVAPMLAPGGTFAVAGCTVTYAGTGTRTMTLAVAHDDSDGAMDDDPSNNAASKVVTVKP